MRSYWLRIGVGALGVFFVGMLAIYLTRRAARQVHRAVAAVAPLALAGIPFQLDGERIGALSGLRIDPGGRNGPPEVSLTVALDSGVDAASVSGCDLTLQRIQDLDSRAAVRCDRGAVPAGPLAPIGTVRFEPIAVVRPLSAPAEQVASWTRSARRGDVVRLRADSHGVLIHVRDDKDRALVHIEADSTGAVFRVRDDSDRVVLNFHADSTGVALDVKPAH